MANPIFQFYLDHPSIGTVEISEPDGWKQASMKLERHPEFHGIIEYFEGAFIFYGETDVVNGGIDYIRTVEQVGVDETLNIIIQASFDSGESYKPIFSGQLDLSSIQELEDNKIQCAIIRNDLWTKFINRYSTPVNLQSTVNLDGASTPTCDNIEVNLTSQVINSRYQAYQETNRELGDVTDDEYFTIDYSKIILNEINETYQYEIRNNLAEIPFYKFYLEYSGDYAINFKTTLTTLVLGTDYLGQATVSLNDTQGGPSGTGSFDGNAFDIVEVYIRINNNEPEPIAPTRRTIPYSTVYGNLFGSRTISGFVGSSTTYYDGSVSDYEYVATLPLNKGDTITIFGKMITSNIGNGVTILGQDGNSYQYGVAQRFDSAVYFYDPESGLFPTATPQGDTTIAGIYWKMTRDGQIQGVQVEKDSIIRALVNTPGQTVSNWMFGRYTNFENKFEGIGETSLNVTAGTVFPSTRCEAFLIHDVYNSASDKITGISNSFYSEFFGSTLTNMRTYLANGCGWHNIITRGLQLKGYYLSNKPISLSMENIWRGTNPIHNLSLCYDKVSGIEVIRVEEKDHVYNPTVYMNISYVKNIKRVYDTDYLIKKVNVGFLKWQSEDVSGIDDPQTKHTYSTKLEKSGREFSIESDFICASLAIEQTRRQSVEKSKDYKFDNDAFYISINEDDTSPDTYSPELSENFTSVNNLLNSSSRYNLRYTPARMILNWLNILNIGLQSYLSSVYKFVYGEGNYDMSSTMVNGACQGDNGGVLLSEKQDIQVTSEALHLPFLYEIEVNMSWDDYLIIRDNRKNAIGISQSNTGHTVFFIKELTYKLCYSRATIKAWPKTFLQITNTEFVPPNVICEVTPEYRLTEDGQRRSLEDGESRIID